MMIDTTDIEKEGAIVCYEAMLKKTVSLELMIDVLKVVNQNLKKEYSNNG